MPSVTSVVYDTGNKVLKDEIREGSDFYELNAPWNVFPEDFSVAVSFAMQ